MQLDPRIALIESESSAERAWQPEPDGFLAMHGYDQSRRGEEPAADAAAPMAAQQARFRQLALGVCYEDGRYLWVLLESFDDVSGYEELARAREGDATYASALHHGSLALRSLVADANLGPRDAESFADPSLHRT